MARLFSAILLLLLSAASFSAAARDVDTHTWGPFYTSNLSFLTASGDAAISGGALQITPDSFNNRFSLLHRSGRMTYNRPFRLWSGDPSSPAASAEIASFNTSFTVNIFRPGNLTAGEGLAFIIAPSGVVPNGSTGQWLGLTNSTIDGSPANRFIAVELDTVMNPNVGDPDGNHIGLDINSVVSNLTVRLSTLDIELSPEIPANWTVWIDYSAATMAFRAFINKEGRPRPSSPVINKTLDLRQIVDQNSYFGFAASTGDNAELNCVLFWNLTVELLPEDKDGKTVVLAIAIAVPVAVLIVAAVLVGAWWWGWRKRLGTEDERMIEGALKSLPGMPREFRLKELKKATNGFDDKQKLGEGGFGVVYKGFVSGVMAGEPAREVAVKKFSRENVKGMDDFLQELTIINRLRHKHLVKLVGWCHANGMLLLVYDYMPNGSLDAHLFRDGDDGGSVGSGKPLLPWDRRYSILAGVASALNYLHHEYDQTVVHRDLKASNILLDSDFTARLGDFGLARALDSEKTSYADLEAAGVPGTLGYIAPECFHTGKATRESDVFGFGAVILEVVCGRRPRSNVSGFSFLVDWVWTLYREDRILESVDLRLNGDYPTEDAERLLKLGLACCHPIAVERPKTQAIVQIISKSVPPPWVPPIKPSFIWPMAGGGMGGDDSSSVMTNDTTPITSSFYGSQYLSRDSQDNSMM